MEERQEWLTKQNALVERFGQELQEIANKMAEEGAEYPRIAAFVMSTAAAVMGTSAVMCNMQHGEWCCDDHKGKNLLKLIAIATQSAIKGALAHSGLGDPRVRLQMFSEDEEECEEEAEETRH